MRSGSSARIRLSGSSDAEDAQILRGYATQHGYDPKGVHAMGEGGQIVLDVYGSSSSADPSSTFIVSRVSGSPRVISSDSIPGSAPSLSSAFDKAMGKMSSDPVILGFKPPPTPAPTPPGDTVMVPGAAEKHSGASNLFSWFPRGLPENPFDYLKWLFILGLVGMTMYATDWATKE